MKKDESDEDLGRTRVVQVGDALSLLLQAQSLMVDSHSLRGIAENMAHRSRTLKKLATPVCHGPRIRPRYPCGQRRDGLGLRGCPVEYRSAVLPAVGRYPWPITQQRNAHGYCFVRVA